MIIQIQKPGRNIRNIHITQFGDILLVDFEKQGFFFQSGTLANRAFHFVHKFFCPTAYGCGATFIVLVFDEMRNAFKLDFVFFSHAQNFRFDREFFFSAVQNHFHCFFGNGRNGVGQFETIFFAYDFKLFEHPTAFVFPQRSKTTFIYR